MIEPQALPEDALTLRRQKAFAVLSIAVIVVLVLGLGWLIGRPLMDALRNKESFRLWINQQGFLKYFIMMGLMIIQIIIAVIPGGPIEIAAGYAFGPWVGSLVCVVGGVLGSALVFWLARRYGMQLVSVFVPKEQLKAAKLLQNKRGMHLALFIVFLVPGTPKDILTYLGGLTPIRMSAFLTITSLARFPAILMAAMGGHSFGVKNYRALALIIVATLIMSVLLVWLYRRHSDRSLNPDEEEQDV